MTVDGAHEVDPAGFRHPAALGIQRSHRAELHLGTGIEQGGHAFPGGELGGMADPSHRLGAVGVEPGGLGRVEGVDQAVHGGLFTSGRWDAAWWEQAVGGCGATWS